MAHWLNAEWLRRASYAAAITACALAGRRERRARGSSDTGVLPGFWFVVAGILSLLLVGRLAGSGSTVQGLGRREAITDGWYSSDRRRVQAAVIIVLGVATVGSIVVVARAMGDRMRRYLAPIVCVGGLAGFAAARIISLHQIDTLLYRRPILGARIASLLELTFTTTLVGLALRLSPLHEDETERLKRVGERTAI